MSCGLACLLMLVLTAPGWTAKDETPYLAPSFRVRAIEKRILAVSDCAYEMKPP